MGHSDLEIWETSSRGVKGKGTGDRWWKDEMKMLKSQKSKVYMYSNIY